MLKTHLGFGLAGASSILGLASALSIVDIGAIGGGTQRSAAYAVNHDGSAVSGMSTLLVGGFRAIRWSAAGLENLNTVPGGLRSIAYDMSDDGNSVADGNVVSGGGHAFLWTPTTGTVGLASYRSAQRVDVTGWTFLTCSGISSDRTALCGEGRRSEGPVHAYVVRGLRPITSPGCVADVDDGSGSGTPDGGVTIGDLLYDLRRFEAGC
jgi:hypothetical protein